MRAVRLWTQHVDRGGGGGGRCGGGGCPRRHLVTLKTKQFGVIQPFHHLRCQSCRKLE